MTDEKVLPTSKQGLNAISAALKMVKGGKPKPKFTAKQLKLLADVKVKLSGVITGIVTPDKLLKALNKLNKESNKTFKR